jgi:hypothetical protein
MFGFIGAHFETLIGAGFIVFIIALGYQTIADDISRR